MPGGQGKIPMRAVRIDDDLWRAAQAEASRRGESVTDAIRRSLRRYARTPAA